MPTTTELGVQQEQPGCPVFTANGLKVGTSTSAEFCLLNQKLDVIAGNEAIIYQAVSSSRPEPQNLTELQTRLDQLGASAIFQLGASIVIGILILIVWSERKKENKV